MGMKFIYATKPNSITKDGSSVDPADDGERHIRPEDGDPIEVEE